MLTLQQIAERETYIGASEASSVCGLNPFQSAWDCWARKLNFVEDFRGNEATEAGDRLEEPVLAWAVDQLGCDTTGKQVFCRHTEHSWMGANLDLTAVLPSHEPVIVEAKTSGITSPLRHENWGEPFTAEVPEMYLCQVQHQFAVAGPEYRRAFLAALLPPRGFVLYEIHRDEEVIEAIVERERQFWHDNVLAGVAPDAAPSHEVAKRLRRKTGKECQVPGDLAKAVAAHRTALKQEKERTEAAEAELLAALGDAEIGHFDGGRVSYLETKRKGYTVEATTYRTLRINLGK